MRRHPNASPAGSKARRRAWGIPALLVLAAALLGFAPSALAAKTVVNTVGTEASGTTGGLFNVPRGIAVNQGGAGGVPAGTFYVADSSNNRIQQFGPNGAFVRTWGFGVRTGEAEFETCTVAAKCRNGLATVSAGGLSAPQTLAVDQATGNVFVANQSNRRIDVFTAKGVFEGGFGWGVQNGTPALQFCTAATGCSAGNPAAPTTGNVGGGQFGTQMGGLALDAAGNLYFADKSSRRVDVFKPLLSGAVVSGVEFLRAYGWGAATGAAAFEVCNASPCKAPAATGTEPGQFGANSPSDVAVDSAGNVFALDAGNKRVQKFNSTPEPVAAAFGATALTEAFGTGSLYALAIDSETDHVFVAGSRSAAASKAAVLETDAAGTKVEVGGADLNPTSANGLAVTKASLGGNLLLSSNSAGQRVYVLNQAPSVAAPTAVTPTSAMLHGSVYSEGVEAGYHFEYSADGTTWTKVPASDLTVAPQAGAVAVEQEVAGLQPASSYTFRLVATRPPGTIPAISSTLGLTTLGAAPAIEGQLASQVTESAARLVGYLNPNKEDTTYRFEYGTTAAYGTSVPVPDADAGSGLGQVTVSELIGGLSPSTTYHFRLVATNGTGTTQGTDATFTTKAAGPAPTPRAYELVSPALKGGSDVNFEGSGAFYMPTSSPSGEAVSYVALNALPGADPVSNGVLNFYRSQRSASGWGASQLSSVIGPVNNLNTVMYSLFNSDYTKGVQMGPLTAPLTPEASDGSNNAYLWDGTEFRLITKGLPAFEPFVNPEFFAGSDDLDHVVFAIFNGKLNEEAPPGVLSILYEWDAATGTPKIVGRLPNGEASPDGVTIAMPPGNSGAAAQNWNPVSDDGSRIYFQTPDNPFVGQLYVRLDGTETKQISESQRTPVDPLGPKGANFRVASEDGSLAFFTSSEKLTNDATTGPTDAGTDLYRYELATETLTDITVDGADPNGAEVQGVLGAADDGSRLYFVAKGVLDAGATAGQNNLYLWTDDGSPDGEVTFVATGVPSDNWSAELSSPQAEHVAGRVTPDGGHALFVSAASLTGFPTGGFQQAYLYDAESGELTCASCNPQGTPATANALAMGTGDNNHFARTLSDDGRHVFFSTAEQLVSEDTNSAKDAYEFDAARGEINLISTGKGEQDARFSDASADGRDAFFVTRQPLVGIDRDSNYDAYDARVGGGIASQNPPPPPVPCEGEECRGPVSSVPPASTPSSSTLNGPGNEKPRHKHHKKKKPKKQKKKHRNGKSNRHGRR